jgi:RNA polymerase sigma-B factor
MAVDLVEVDPVGAQPPQAVLHGALDVRRLRAALSLAVEREAEALSAELARTPTAAEIAERAGLTVEEVLEARHATAAHRSLSLVTERTAEDGAWAPMDPGALDDGYARAEERARLVTMLGSLRPHERRIVLLRFHDEMSQRDIGRLVGMSQMGVSRLLKRSLDRMREAAEG